MTTDLIEISAGFWNIRGSFKVGGFLDVGTHCSLAQLQSGDFVLLDGVPFSDEIDRRIAEHTDRGRAIRAVLHLHPFHTLHVTRCAQRFPNAKLYGTARHKRLAPSLPWQELETDSPRLHELFGDDFSFSVPRGVDFIPSNEQLHFCSVLAIHRGAGVLHVDDTLSWLSLPLLGDTLQFHPTLPFVLQRRRGAVDEFRAWVEELVRACEPLTYLCTAHGKTPPPRPLGAPSLAERIGKALGRVEFLLSAHQRRHG